MPAFLKGPDFKPVIPGGPTLPFNFIFNILSFIFQLIGVLSSPIPGIERAINNTWSNVVMTTAFLYNGLGFLTDFIKKLLGTLFDGLKHIISDILHGHLVQMIKDIQALLRALHNLFAPLLAWLRRLQQIQRQMQLQTLKRVVNLIQRARRFLVLFKLLHMKWATKLDNFLAGVEGKIIARELDIVRKTNQLIGFINMITDPFGTLHPVPLLAPFTAALKGMLDAIKGTPVQGLFPGLTQVWTPVPAGAPGPVAQLPGPAHSPVQIP